MSAAPTFYSSLGNSSRPSSCSYSLGDPNLADLSIINPSNLILLTWIGFDALLSKISLSWLSGSGFFKCTELLSKLFILLYSTGFVGFSSSIIMSSILSRSCFFFSLPIFNLLRKANFYFLWLRWKLLLDIAIELNGIEELLISECAKLDDLPPLLLTGIYGDIRAFFNYSFLYLFDLSFDFRRFIAWLAFFFIFCRFKSRELSSLGGMSKKLASSS